MRQNIQLLLLALCSIYIYLIVGVSSIEYKPRFQPELDNIKIDAYMKNKRLFDLQVKCIIYDGPCDIVGRWVKPRVAGALLGTCLLCTPRQHEKVNVLLQWLQEDRPETFRLLVEKYLESQGISVPKDKTFGPVTSKPYDPSQDPNYNANETTSSNTTNTTTTK